MRARTLSWLLIRVLVVVTAALLLSTCRFEELAPERSFAPEDLLVDEKLMPSGWKALGLPFLPAGDDLVTHESTAIQFGVADREPSIQAEQDVFRYQSAGGAQRKFEFVYLPPRRHFDSVSEWMYQSPFAGQSYFGCYDWAGRSTPVCEWAGQYEEYIVVFWTRMTPGEVSLADIERVVRAIDGLMVDKLGETGQ